MDLIAIAMGLAQFAPSLVKWISGSDKAEAVAQKAIDTAKLVTGVSNPGALVTALQSNPDLVLKFRQAILDQAVQFEQLAVKNAEDINATMRAEAESEHWPTFTWRPAIGLAVAIDLVMSAIVVLVAYVGVMFFKVDPIVLSYIPGFLGSMSILIGVATPILGIASWFRGKMQADPTIPTINRG
jgi:uncharacterized membrane protein YidH (DUF202 family)